MNSGSESGDEPELQPGTRIEYTGESVFDELIQPGDVAVVARVEQGWVFATWPRSEHEHSVPVANIRPLGR